MKRRVLLVVLVVLLLIPVGGYFWLQSNVDVITGAIGRAVESATGRPLLLTEAPSLSVFPQVGLDIGKARWGDPAKDDIAVDLNGAQLRVPFAPLLSHIIEINSVVLDPPTVIVRQTPAYTSHADTPETETPGTPASETETSLQRHNGALSLHAMR